MSETKKFYCCNCYVELNKENSCTSGFMPYCTTCEKKDLVKKFKHRIGGILDKFKGIDVAYYTDQETEKIIVNYQGETFYLTVEHRD